LALSLRRLLKEKRSRRGDRKDVSSSPPYSYENNL
jgi:hypothetical protein